MKKKIAFVFAFSSNLAFAAGNCAIALNRYMKDKNYDIVMLHNELPENDITAFSKIDHVILKRFELNEDFVQQMLNNLPKDSRFRTRNHLMCFGHFEAFKLLREYKTVIYNDVDISIQKDLSPLLKYGPIGLTEDTPWKVRDQFTKPIDGYSMDTPSFCSAVMVLNDSIPYEDMYQYLWKSSLELSKFLINPDQSIINLALQKFNLTPKLIPLNEYQCISWKDEAITSSVVHFGTDKKVWNNTNICNAFPEWYRTHLLWLDLGGSDFDQTKITPRNCRGTLDAYDNAEQKIKDLSDKLRQKENSNSKRKDFYISKLLVFSCVSIKNITRYKLFGKLTVCKSISNIL